MDEWKLPRDHAQKVASLLVEDGLSEEQRAEVRRHVAKYSLHNKVAESRMDHILKADWKLQSLMALVEMLYRQRAGMSFEPGGDLTITLDQRRRLAFILLLVFDQLWSEVSDEEFDPDQFLSCSEMGAEVLHLIFLLRGDRSDVLPERREPIL